MNRNVLAAAATTVALSAALVASATTADAAPASSSPSFAYTSVTCVVTGHVKQHGKTLNTYEPKLTWKVNHATGMALSVDNPGFAGAYGTYGPKGSLHLYTGCYKGDSHLIEFYTVGGHGKAAHKTYHLKGTHTRPAGY